MSDNLNVNTNVQPGDANSPINNVPTKSPLEQSAPVGPVAVQGGPVPTPVVPAPTPPATPAAASPFPPDAPVAVNQPAPVEPQAVAPAIETPAPIDSAQPTVNLAPPTENADLGESAPAPDTDEFLKSILQEQPQPTASNLSDANLATQDMMPGENAPVNPPLEEPTPMASINNPIETPAPNLNDKPIDQIASQPQNVERQVQPQAPEAMPEVNFNSGQKLTDNVALDGVNSASTAPQPPAVNSDTPVSSDVFAGGEPPKSSGLKRIILIVLVLVVAAGGYYAYTVLMGGTAKTSNSTSASKSVTTSTASTISSTADSQRKADLIVIQQALIDFSSGNSGQYPVSANTTFLNLPGNILEQELVPNYLSKLPVDPSSSKAYGYKSDGQTFTLTAELDNANDPEATLVSGKSLYEVNSTTVSGSSTNSSTNPTSSTQSSSTGATVIATPTSVSSSGSSVDTAQVGDSVITTPPVPGSP